MTESIERREEPADGPARPAGAAGAINVECLFAGAREVRLIFGGQEYRLRITRNSKLILTK